MSTITAMRMAPTSARPSTGAWPAVNAYSSDVMTIAPIAGPSQWRVPPSALISTTLTASAMEKVSATVT